MRFLLVLPLLTLISPAQEPPAVPDPAAEAPQAANPFEGLEFKTGTIQLPKKVARLELAPGYRYISASDARMVLEQVPHCPPPSTKGIQGMVIPPNPMPGAAAGWLALIVYAEEGHVGEDQIKDLNPALFMDQLKAMNEAENKKLKAKNEPTYELVHDADSVKVWGSSMGSGSLRYNPTTKVFTIPKRYWNERAPNGERERVEHEHWALGRRGVMVIRAFSVAGLSGALGSNSERVAEMVEFTTGNRYQDFNKTTDKRSSLVPEAVQLAAAGSEAKQGVGKIILRKLPWLIIVGLALLLKRWITKIEEA